MEKTPGVVVSYLFPDKVDGFFALSLADMVQRDAMNEGYLKSRPDGGIIAVSTGPRVAEGRNSIIDHFGQNYPGADWLLMIDSDMTFDSTLLRDLMAQADPQETPIVGGLCFAGGRSGKVYPTVYRSVQKDGYASIERVYDYPKNAMVKVGATGGACLLIHRTVLVAMKKEFGKTPSGATSAYPWFVEGIQGPQGEAWGEDIAFCLRAQSLGIPIWVHTGVKLGHRKTHTIDEVYYDNYRRSIELTEQGAFDDEPTPQNRAARRAAARKKQKVS